MKHLQAKRGGRIGQEAGSASGFVRGGIPASPLGSNIVCEGNAFDWWQ